MTRLVLVLTHLIAAGAGAAMAWWWQDRRARPWQVHLPPDWAGPPGPDHATVTRSSARSRALQAMRLEPEERQVLAAARPLMRWLLRRGRLGAELRARGYWTVSAVARAAGVPRDVARRVLHGDRVGDLPVGVALTVVDLVTSEVPAIPPADRKGAGGS